jgi:hypothetical protein
MGERDYSKESYIVVMEADSRESTLPVEGVTLGGQDGIHLVLNCSVFNATLFDPLNMKTALIYDTPGEIIPNRAAGYRKTGQNYSETNIKVGTIYGATWTTGYSSYALDFDSFSTIPTLSIVPGRLCFLISYLHLGPLRLTELMPKMRILCLYLIASVSQSV